MSEQITIPSLRFDNFTGIWKETSLGKLGAFLGGGTPTSTKKDHWAGNIPWISSSDIIEDNIHQINKTRFITEKAIKQSATKIIPKNAILIVSRVGIGKFAVANEDLCTSQDFTNLITDQNSYFLAYYFGARVNEFKKLSQGTSIKGFTVKDIKDAKFALPDLVEQQKIATFLSAVDEKLNLLQKKKQGLEQYKKGVMQPLFSQKLRFKKEDGSDYPDWEEKKLGEIGTTLNGLTGKTKENFGTGKPYIQYKQIFDSSKIDIFKCGLVDILPNETQTKIKYGDIFFTTSSETPNEIGTTSVLLDEVDEMYLNSFCFGFRVDDSILNPSFAQFLFRSADFRRKMIPLAQGSTRYNISKSSFVKLLIYLPSISEQIQIANFLSSIDSKIELIKNHLESTQQFKKGLLQQMFV